MWRISNKTAEVTFIQTAPIKTHSWSKFCHLTEFILLFVDVCSVLPLWWCSIPPEVTIFSACRRSWGRWRARSPEQPRRRSRRRRCAGGEPWMWWEHCARTKEPWTGASWTATDESDGRFLLRLQPLDLATCDPAVSACFFSRDVHLMLVNSPCPHHNAWSADLTVTNKG